MRSLKAERKPARRGRAKLPRRSTMGTRIPAERFSFGRRKRGNNPFSKFLRNAREKLTLRRPMLLLTFGLVGFTLVVALFAGGYVGRTISGTNNAIGNMITDSGFAVSAIHVSGNHRTAPRTIFAVLGFVPGQTIFSTDLWRARAKLMQLDWVASADVRRRYPDDISVTIVEKRPFALWKSPEGFYVVERSGGLITDKNLAAFTHLPLLIGLDAATTGAELADAVALHRAVAARVQAMERVSDRRWDLILDDGVVVKLPETGWRKELDVLEHLIVDKAILERDIREIDLRSPDVFIFIMKNGQEQHAVREKAA